MNVSHGNYNLPSVVSPVPAAGLHDKASWMYMVRQLASGIVRWVYDDRITVPYSLIPIEQKVKGDIKKK